MTHADDSGLTQFSDVLAVWVQKFLSRRSVQDIEIAPHNVWGDGPDRGSSINVYSPLLSWSNAALIDGSAYAEWETVQEAALCWEILAHHLGRGIVGIESSCMVWDLNLLLRPFLPKPYWDALNMRPLVPVFDRENFEKLFDEFTSLLRSNTLEYLTQTVLIGMRIDGSMLPCQLSDDISLDRLSQDDIARFGAAGLLKPFIQGVPGLYDFPGYPFLALNWRRNFPKKFTESKMLDATAGQAEYEQVHQSLIQSLALLSYGVVGVGASMTRLLPWPFLPATQLRESRIREPTLLWLMTNSLTIAPDKVTELSEIFQQVFGRSHEDALAIALRRLGYASERTRPEDRFLDDMIAAEALLGEGGNEISYKMRLRIAFALAPKNKAERLNHFELMKRAYTVRSSLVHGVIPNPKNLVVRGQKVAFQQFVETVEDMIRALALTAVKNTSGPFKVEDWDSIILGADVQG